MSWKTCNCDDRPGMWLGNAPGVELGATGLRALAARLTDGLAGPGEQALALFRHVSWLPFELSDPALRTSPAALHCLAAGDGYFKATLWLHDRWQSVDAYAMDPPLFGVVVSEIRRRQLMAGYFVHRDGLCTWDGQGDALQRFSPSDPDSCPIRDMGCFHSHADFLRACRQAVPETAVTNMAYENQTRLMNEAFARMRASA